MEIFGFNIIDILVICTYLIGVTALGLYMTRKVKTVGDYFLGGRKFGKVFTAARDFGLGTSTDEPVVVVGSAYSIGLAGVWYSLINIFATPFYWVVRPWFRRLRLYTMGDYCEKRFGRHFGYFYSVFGALNSAILLGLVLKGTSSAVVGVSGGMVPLWAVILVMAALFICYGGFGGQHAAVVTDFVQGIFIIILSFLLIPFCIYKAGGMEKISQAVPKDFFNLISETEVTFGFVIMATIVTLTSSMGNPNAATVIGKTEWETRMGMSAGMLLKRLCTIAWAFSGVFYLAVNTGITDRDQVFGTAIANILPVGFVGLMVAALMATGMSTCSGFMIIAGSYFVKNFYTKVASNKSEEHYLMVSRVASVSAACLGVLFAMLFPTLVDLLKYAWVMLSFVGIAVWVSFGWRRANRWGAWATVLVSFVTHAVCAYRLKYSFELTALIYLSVGYLVMVIVSLLTPREPKEQLDEFYALLHTKIGEEDRLKYADVEIMHY